MISKKLLRFSLWFILIQFLLLNLSAYLYAYRLTHFSDIVSPSPLIQKNVINKTWDIFSGPLISKITGEEQPDFGDAVNVGIVDGVKINGWSHKTVASAPWVIFINGPNTNNNYYKHEVARFVEWGYNILTIDPRGYGNSEGETTSLGYKETAEVKAAYDWVRSQNARRIILYGSSMGAAVIIKSVADGLVKPDAIIADMAFASLHDHYKSRARSMGFPSQPFAFLFTFWTGLQQGYNGFGYDVAEYAKKIELPILLQWGDSDQLVNKEETIRIFQNIPSTEKSLVVYAGADHHSFLLTHPYDWEEQVKSFTEAL
jgi:uncharacterized protein